MKQVSIVGAGLVGSLWAIYMAKRGYQVNVYERRSDIREEQIDGGRSINLALSDRGIKALAGADLENEVRRMAIPMHGRLIHDLHGDTNLQPYGLEGQYINSISRAGLNRLLIEKADSFDNLNFFFNHRCLDVDLQTSKLTFEDDAGGILYSEADLVFGTDGAFSAVRTGIMKTDRFNYEQFYLEHGYKELCIPASDTDDFRLEPNALHIWPRKNFMLIALPNQDRSFTCTLFLGFEGERSFAKLTSKQAVRQFFEEEFPDAVPHMPDLEEDFFNNPTGSLVTVRCFPWSYNNNILLMGDAAHAIVPFYGQGMNAGFEDCTILNELISDHDEDWPKILHQFELTRKEDANAIADLAMRNFIEMRDLVADDRFVLRKKVEKLMHAHDPKEYLPLYSMVTFSHIPYGKALRMGKLYDKYFEQLDDEELMLVAERPDSAQAQTLLDSWLDELKQLQS